MLYAQEALRLHGYKWAMHSGEMMEALGLKSGGHLPAEGMPERLIQGVRVYVRPAVILETVIHTCCRHCGGDIEGLHPFPKGDWRDRGNNTHCNNGPLHAPEPSRLRRAKSSHHRVMAICPGCNRHMSAGRLVSQHLKHCKGAK